MSRVTALPRFHDTVTLPVISRPDGLRVVVTADGILGSLVRFFELDRNRNKSQSWQQKVCRAVGLLYDYYVAFPPPADLASRRIFLSNFARALIQGTIRADGTDPTDLYWRPAGSWNQVKETLLYVTAFGNHCAKKNGANPLNPLIEATFGERVATFHKLDKQNSQSLLSHLGSARAMFAKSAEAHEITPRRPPKVADARPPYFPWEMFTPLIHEGFRREQSKTAPWQSHSIRDIMITVLQRFGGLRASEAFHLFTRDVREDPNKPGHALVLLFHPELGLYRYPDPLQRRVIETTRVEYLRSQCDREPRNLMSGKDYVGWKDLMLDKGSPHYYSLVRWFPSAAGALFWKLYQMYVEHVLPSRLGHPYLFVTLDAGTNYGKPYRLAAYYRNLSRAVESVGLKSSKSLGTTSHGLRHAYGQSLADAKLDSKVIQTCLHQKSPLSQEVYTRPELERVNRELEAARLRLASETLESLVIPDLPGLPYSA